MLKYGPGFALIFVINLLARFIQSQITVNGKEVVSAVAIAIILGVFIRNLIGIPDSCKPGTSFAVKRILRVGIGQSSWRMAVTPLAFSLSPLHPPKGEFPTARPLK